MIVESFTKNVSTLQALRGGSLTLITAHQLHTGEDGHVRRCLGK